MISDIKENRNQETQMTEDKSSSLPCKFDFDKKKGWLQMTKSGNRVYANKHLGHGKVLGGANDFARANVREMRSPENFPENPQGISDTILYHCLRHDYVYYPQDFVDTNGVQRKRGYYDEACEYHENIKILYYPQSSGVVCKYCGHNTIFDVNGQNMDDFWCSQCGAEINYMKQLDEEYDFLVYADAFASAKAIKSSDVPKTEYVPPQKNESYHMPRKKFRGQEMSYGDYLKETFETSVEEGELSKLSLDDSLEYIQTREYNPAPVKEWKPSGGPKVTKVNGITTREYNPAPVKEWKPNGEDNSKEPKEWVPNTELIIESNQENSERRESRLKQLEFDEPLQYIKTREYNPAPVKEWKPNEDVKTTQAPRVVREAKVLKTTEVNGIVTREYNPEKPQEWEPNTNLIIASNQGNRERRKRRLKQLEFDEPLQYIKTREYKPAPVVQQTYRPENYRAEYVSKSEIDRKSSNKEILEQAVMVFEDVLEIFSPSDKVATIKGMDVTVDAEGKRWKTDPDADVWSVSDDADYDMFKK